MERILAEIIQERERNDLLGGCHAELSTPQSWREQIRHQLDDDTESFRRRLLDIAALAVTAIEQIDREESESTNSRSVTPQIRKADEWEDFLRA